MLAFFAPGRAMNEGPHLQLGEALDLIQAIDDRCRQLRRQGGPDVEQQVVELEAVVSEIRKQLNLVIVTASQTRDR